MEMRYSIGLKSGEKGGQLGLEIGDALGIGLANGLGVVGELANALESLFGGGVGHQAVGSFPANGITVDALPLVSLFVDVGHRSEGRDHEAVARAARASGARGEVDVTRTATTAATARASAITTRAAI